MNSEEAFSEYRPLLFSIAYRMLGTVMDAEDMVQETYLRWQRVSATTVDSPKSYLAAVVTRLCIDHLRSAKVKRETYIGPWLPEPVLTSKAPTLMETTMLAESLSTAFLVLLENLNPVERAVYLLREVFDYDYSEIAKIVDKSEANCRQLASRARRFIRDRRPRFAPDPDQEAKLTEQFLTTVAEGDMSGLLEILADDIVVYSDGGGKVFAAKKPVAGKDLAAKFIFGLARLAPDQYELQFAYVNGYPGMVIYVDGSPLTVIAMRISGGKIKNMYSVLNPDKLKNIKARGF